MASQQPKSEAGASAELDAAEVERRRKQRDLKRKSRERKKVREAVVPVFDYMRGICLMSMDM